MKVFFFFFPGKKDERLNVVQPVFQEIWFRISICRQFYSKVKLNPLPGSSVKG